MVLGEVDEWTSGKSGTRRKLLLSGIFLFLLLTVMLALPNFISSNSRSSMRQNMINSCSDSQCRELIEKYYDSCYDQFKLVSDAMKLGAGLFSRYALFTPSAGPDVPTMQKCISIQSKK